ncbi:MAG TPA: hypothetical protein VGB82_04890 [Alphaproteobacteria bacterium]
MAAPSTADTTGALSALDETVSCPDFCDKVWRIFAECLFGQAHRVGIVGTVSDLYFRDACGRFGPKEEAILSHRFALTGERRLPQLLRVF